MRPLFGAASSHFLGWWNEDDLVWRDEQGEAIGYLEPAYGPWSLDEEAQPLHWEPGEQAYAP